MIIKKYEHIKKGLKKIILLAGIFFLETSQALAQGTGNVLPNPIAAASFQELIKKVLDIVLQIGIPVAALALVYSGFLFVKARGNPEELKTAKNTFLWTVIGVAILLGAWVLATVIKGTIDKL